MVIDEHLIIAALGAVFGAIPGLLSAWAVYRRSSAKIKLQTDASEAKLAAARADIEAKRLAAQAEYEQKVSDAQADLKQRMDESDQQNKLIDAIIEQGKGAKDLAESVRQIASSIRDNTQATNDLKDSVEKGTRKTAKLDENVDDFAARLVRATTVMERSNEEIQGAKNAIEATSQQTQENSTNLANTILDQIAELKKIVLDTRDIAQDIDERVKRLEAKPDPAQLPAISEGTIAKDVAAPLSVVVEVKPIETKVEAVKPPEEKSNVVPNNPS